MREPKFHALGVSVLVDGIPASDRRYYPLCAKAVEPDIPVRIYSSMNYATDRPYDLGHRRHLDQVAIDFPADHHRRPRGLALGDAQGAGGALGRPRRTAARDLDQEYMALLLKDTVKEKSAWRPRTASARSCRPR